MTTTGRSTDGDAQLIQRDLRKSRAAIAARANRELGVRRVLAAVVVVGVVGFVDVRAPQIEARVDKDEEVRVPATSF